MSRAALTIGVTIRLLGETHERLVERRRETRVPTNCYVEQAIIEKLDRDDQATKQKPRHRAAS